MKEFGMMNSIIDLCEQFSAYKFDDIFDWSYPLYHTVMKKNAITNDIKNKMSEPD